MQTLYSYRRTTSPVLPQWLLAQPGGLSSSIPRKLSAGARPALLPRYCLFFAVILAPGELVACIRRRVCGVGYTSE